MPLNLLSTPRRQTATALLASVIAVPLLGYAAFQQSQPAAPRAAGRDGDGAARKYRDRTHAAWLPPGRYHSIIIATNAEERRWIVSLRTERESFPITVAAAENTVVTFPEPWTVGAGDDARLESIDVPFGDIARESLLAEGNVCLSAWGITDTGPVAFVVRPARP